MPCTPRRLLQAHAPLTAEQLDSPQPSRLLYVLGCTAEGCGKQPGCWRALRLVVPAAPVELAASPAAQHQQAQQHQVPAMPPPDDWGVSGADDWGVGTTDDWGGDEAGNSGAERFDFGDLNAALEAVGSSSVGGAPAAKAAAKGRRGGDPAGSLGQVAPVYDPARSCLPAFYLYAEPESQCGSSGKGGAPTAEQRRYEQLLAEYERQEAAMGGASALAAPPGGPAACAPSVEGGGEGWGGEGYEEDAVLAPAGGKRPGLGAAFLKFSRQLARCPDQCARYW